MLACAKGIAFPDGFLFGTSTSAHQTEGGNTTSDWWQLEHRTGRIPEPSGDAADSYHRWPVDMDLLAELGFTDYRFGIEWARIEPEPGHFSRAALAHYRRMVDGALERGLRPMVTLHHFTLPRWFAERGGWRAPDAVERFARYVAATAPVITDGVRHVCTINEPNTVAALHTLTAADPPSAPGLPLPDPELTAVLIAAHRAAAAAVRAVSPRIQVGWSVANQCYQAVPGAEEVTAAYRHPREDVFLEAARADDWVGVQAYTRTRIGPRGPLPVREGAELTLTGREFYPEALGEAVRHTAEVVGDVPVIVTGNGLATRDDSRRISYTHQALRDLAAALADGLDIRGYLHRSALDGYEWGSYRPTFGLITVDPQSFLRVPKPSARWLGRIARSGFLPAP
ncbi:beta-glucosidase [Kitasatospora gansuensis]|uniref:Beta-glucosidase n=1 Tax=Kitasatospora gansuensis TaxID=258050 RepID=A0A7W7WIN5_9ACTN|nr:family 1 glycosylhydrolase [Kitasatospora gansuensis]MBB4948987.1 beta-glucosidase [Kitasatospora gansuensis]